MNRSPQLPRHLGRGHHATNLAAPATARNQLRLTALFLACAAALFAAEAADIPFPLPPGRIEIVPSFEACSYYFRPETAADRYVVQFRRLGEQQWQRAFDPVTDKPAGIWKGSVFDLAEGASFQLRVLTPPGAEVIRPTEFRTWSSRPPIAKTIDLSRLPNLADGLVISEQGSADGWIKYTAPPGWRFERKLDLNDSQSAAISFRGARYVILENVTVVGGARHGLLIDDSDAVRISNCDISGWGRPGVQLFTNTGTRGKYADAKGETINYDAGVSINRSARTVVERCYIHDPRSRANSWMFSHPAGPTAMHVNNSRGGTVVRWNDFVGSDEHRWNDVIESSNNGAAEGGFFRDSDISGNFLAFGNDDGVELEGGGMNVRFYRNKIEGTACSISTAACVLGPQFVFGNLVTNPGDEAGLALWFFKNSHGVAQSGKRHFINNTLYAPGHPPGAYGAYGKPIGDGRLGFMRNNVFVCGETRLPGEWAKRDDFDSDLFWAGPTAATAVGFLEVFRTFGQERNGLAFDPQFVNPARADFHLAAGSLARGKGAGVANLAAPGANLGAFSDDSTEVPFRPLALVAAPRELNFTAPTQAARMQVTLSLPATAQESVPFEIRQNKVFTWFKVTPAAGKVAPGEKLTLEVTVDPAVLRGRPRFKGAFLVRTPAGLSRPVSVYATADFQEDLRPGAARDAVYLAATTPEVGAKFTLARAGAYSLLARAAVKGDVMRRRNFEVALDGVAAPAGISINTDYQWNTGATNSRVIFLHALGELQAGEHRLHVRLANGELDVTEYIVTDNPAVFFIDDWQKERK